MRRAHRSPSVSNGVVLWQEKIPVFLRGGCFESALKHVSCLLYCSALAQLRHVIGIHCPC